MDNVKVQVCVHLCEVADLSAEFTLHLVDRTLELAQLSVQKAGVVFVFGELQNDITCKDFFISKQTS